MQQSSYHNGHASDSVDSHSGPSHPVAPQPGPSSFIPSFSDDQQQRRKRPASPHPDVQNSDQRQSSNSRDPPKKKKAARACFHCQKAHLTCDDSRPCQRCIKRGIGDSCTEGQRKKAKYLLDEHELRSDVYSPGASNIQDPIYDLPFDNSFTFGSEGANLEYSMINALLNSATSLPENHSSRPSNLSSSHSGLPNNSFPLSSMNGSGSGIDQQVMNGAPPDAAAAYASVSRPYDYTAGYHYLMQHLQNRMNGFDKNDILRIVRALAIFRPSLIALQMPLTLEDEIFVEKCFQRSLVELDKLISMSGTPTVVWRRTGEICLVGMEFSLLTEWPPQELIRGKFIYELFETQSTVEYWENFAAHAFENTARSVYSHCVLRKKSGSPVPCAFCFSIRRDLFDLPSIVIGELLYYDGELLLMT
ncbi:hypothetical protein SISNIDRAFT_410363 [Sistotremastrum niveocremeum HHB9708]|uniref:Transcription activator of gluconeogenesis ERT1 n=1 Tax=Sistotremastrum niveocremeum HHB9708 TaxID=1314777 RepID=A0A164VA53_9AGAM|nr:hypothetical protein SISNIDRAFT_410363 [Sistotremastrum niveocremeum HHB9708]